MKVNMNLSIVILNFNSKNYLFRCLDSIKKSNLENLNIEIIVVDNNSYDGSQELLNKTKSPLLNFKFIANKQNLGF